MKEKLEKQIAEYRDQQKQLQNNLIALDGAIQALERLLNNLDEGKLEKPPTAK